MHTYSIDKVLNTPNIMIDILLNKISRKKLPQTSVNDRHVKSLIKAVSWRAVGTIDTIMISWILTGKIAIAVSIGSVEVFSKIFLYYLHERIWNIIRWGRINVIIRNNSRNIRKMFELNNIKARMASFF